MNTERLEAQIGRAVRSLRIDAGLSRRSLATNANVSIGALENLETGKGATIRTLVRALEALGATQWLDKLYTPPPAFSPLALVDQARAEATRERRAPRVSRARKAAPPARKKT